MAIHPKRLLLAALLTPMLLLGTAFNAWADERLNGTDLDIKAYIQAIGEISGRNFIIDPRVKGKVTVLTNTNTDSETLYQTFLAVLQVHGYAAVEAGPVTKIIPEVGAKQAGGQALSYYNADPDEIVTRVVQVQFVPAAQLVPLLRPLVPQYGHLAAYPAANVLIISDRAENVKRLTKIISRIDQSSDADVEVVKLENASATEVVRILGQLTQGAGTNKTDPNANLKLIPDDRTNSVFISGDKKNRLQARAMLAHLDTPVEQEGNTQVIYLRYAKAETLAPILSGYAAESGQAGGQTGGNAAANRSNQASTTILADPDTNSLVITAPPKTMRSIKSVIEQLDIRRAQVMVEAVIAEVSTETSRDLGVQSGVQVAGSVGGALSNIGASGSNPSLSSIIASAVTNGAAGAVGSVGSGFTGVGGRFENSGLNFAILLRALATDANTNILSTPTLVTMDNEPAEISVGQEVPFLTGQFTNTGAATTNAVNPFQTIQRQNIGITLKITPQINEGDTVQLKIEQEVSSLGAVAATGVDQITNRRVINTTVLIEDGEVVVLGGLIDDNVRETHEKVPLLGDVPLVGNLFKYRSARKEKRNLMVFIRPAILRSSKDAEFYTRKKYDYIRQLQQQQVLQDGNGSFLLPEENRLPLMLRMDDFRGRPSVPVRSAPAAQPQYQPQHTQQPQYQQPQLYRPPVVQPYGNQPPPAYAPPASTTPNYVDPRVPTGSQLNGGNEPWPANPHFNVAPPVDDSVYTEGVGSSLYNTSPSIKRSNGQRHVAQ